MIIMLPQDILKLNAIPLRTLGCTRCSSQDSFANVVPGRH
jgi:hypothetical protein